MHTASKTSTHARGQNGITRLDAIFCLGTVMLLGCVLLPALAAVGSNTQQLECVKNLKKLGLAYTAWAADHGNRMPWRVSVKDGGTHDLRGHGTVWVQQIWISNFLDSPKFLACPADKVKVATSWGRNSDGGFLNPQYRGNAVSYFVGIDVKEESPRSLLGGDGNLQASAYAQTCDYADVKTAASLAPGNAEVEWTKAVHQGQGNLLQLDGSVIPTLSGALRKLLLNTGAVHKDNHVLLPR